MTIWDEISYVWQAKSGELFAGIANTLIISLSATLIGLLIGLVIGIIRTVPKPRSKVVMCIQKFINFILSAYIEIFRGTPMMVQAMVVYFGYAAYSGGQTLNPIFIGIFIVSINTGAYMAEIVRGGIISIDKGQFEGGMSIGMNHFQIMIYIVLPQAMRNILPSISNEFVVNIKDTSVLNVINVTELFYRAGIVASDTYMTLATYVIVAIIYFFLTFTVTRIIRIIERVLNGNSNYTISGSQTTVEGELHITKQGGE